MQRARGGGAFARTGSRGGGVGRGAAAAGNRKAGAGGLFVGGSSKARSAADAVADRIIHDIGDSASSSEDDDHASASQHSRNPVAAASAAALGAARGRAFLRGKASEPFAEKRGGDAGRVLGGRLERAPLTSAAVASRARNNMSNVYSPESSSPGSPGEPSSGAVVMHGRCIFNQVDGSTRRCRGRRAGGLCEGCERVRDRWTARLMTEFQVGMSRSQIHMLLNRFMDLNKSREHLRNIQEARSPTTSPIKHSTSAPAKRAEAAPATEPTAAAAAPAPQATGDIPSRQEAGAVQDCAAGAPHSISSAPGLGMCTPETTKRGHFCSPIPQKKSPVHDLLTLFSASAHVGSQAVAECGGRGDDRVQSTDGKAPLPHGFCLCGISGGGLKEVWRKEGVRCWVCGNETLSEGAAVAAMVIGGMSVESRSKSVSRYGGLPCVPVLTCGCKGCDGVGRSQALSAVWWCSKWVAVPDFLVISEGYDEYIEAPEGPCRERVILQILHWFSKTHEDPEDRHACFLPPPLDRDCAIVCRDSVACSYSTLTLQADNGFALPTLHTIFVKSSHRRMGCAQQLLLGFFRPSGGRFRRPRASGCNLEEPPKPQQQPPLSTRSLEFEDRLGIEPPVSDALILTMAKIFSLAELENIMMLFSGVPLSAAKNAKSVLGHMRSKEALQKQEANTPLRRIRAGREGRTQIRGGGRGGGGRGGGFVARG